VAAGTRRAGTGAGRPQWQAGGPSGRRPQQAAGDGRCVAASQLGEWRRDPATMEQLG